MYKVVSPVNIGLNLDRRLYTDLLVIRWCTSVNLLGAVGARHMLQCSIWCIWPAFHWLIIWALVFDVLLQCFYFIFIFFVFFFSLLSYMHYKVLSLSRFAATVLTFFVLLAIVFNFCHTVNWIINCYALLFIFFSVAVELKECESCQGCFTNHFCVWYSKTIWFIPK